MFYTTSHEWVRFEGDKAVVGVSNHAQKELGEIVYIELPLLGHTVETGRELAVLESTKAAADVYSPIAGVVCAVNEELKISPHLVNSDPEGKGWIAKLQLAAVASQEGLMDATQYALWLEQALS